MQYTSLTPTKWAIIEDSSLSTYNDHSSSQCYFYNSTRYPIDRKLVIGGFSALPDNIKRKKVVMFGYRSDVTKESWIEESSVVYADQVGISAFVLNGTFESETVTGANVPSTCAVAHSDIVPSGSINGYAFCKTEATLNRFSIELFEKMRTNGFVITSQYISGASNTDRCYTPTPNYAVGPELLYYTEDEDNGYVLYGESPSSGFVPKYSANTFTWSTFLDGLSYTDPTISSIEFRWRPTGTSSYTTISCSENSCTIPANTFTTDSIDWCVVITDSFGATVSSDWHTLSTLEATSTATADSPNSVIIDNTIVNRFTWSHIISTGTDPTKSELQISTDGSTWTALATINNSNTYYDAPASSITTGQKYWRVRTYNTDSSAGSWSDSATFVSLGAPVLNGVAVDASPRPTIRWQCSDFCGYQVVVDDIFDTGVKYGTVYSYKSPVYLPDGDYTASVRLINQYGIWSDWVTAGFSVSNTAGTAISLTYGLEDSAVKLHWELVSGYSAYIVYRDGVPINKTTGVEYIDYFSSGTHAYYVRGIYSSSENYGLSNTCTIDVYTEYDMISLVDDIDWLSLERSTLSIACVNYSHNSRSTTRYYSSSKYPVAETAQYRSTSVRGNAAFQTTAECDKFENMIGNVVCLKTSKGIVVFGLLGYSSKEDNTFYTVYDYSIEQVEFDEEIEI